MKNGGRVFDINVENQQLTGLDVYVEAGANAALVKTFVVNADSLKHIEFGHQVQNPAVRAIEGVRLDTTLPVINEPSVPEEPQEQEQSVPDFSVAARDVPGAYAVLGVW